MKYGTTSNDDSDKTDDAPDGGNAGKHPDQENTPQVAPAEPETPEIKLPPRGTTGPVHISKLLEPLQQIIRHPDRNRLLAEFFKDA